MKLTNYLYKGPQSGVELRVQDGAKVELLEAKLNPGKTVGLPADHEYTKTLLAMKYLELAPEAPKKGDKA
jgi:hypothetical protein